MPINSCEPIPFAVKYTVFQRFTRSNVDVNVSTKPNGSIDGIHPVTVVKPKVSIFTYSAMKIEAEVLWKGKKRLKKKLGPQKKRKKEILTLGQLQCPPMQLILRCLPSLQPILVPRIIFRRLKLSRHKPSLNTMQDGKIVVCKVHA